jgi:hypothetical protein
MMIFMPTTLSGLFLFVVLLLPGFAYVVGRERHTSGQSFSAFRETAIVVAASVTFELVVLGLFAIIRILAPSVTPDVGALVRNGGSYLQSHYELTAGWAVVLLMASVALAYAASAPAVRRKIRIFATAGKWLPRGIRNFAGGALEEGPHESIASGWWKIFDEWAGEPEEVSVRVRCFLGDGSCVEGELGSFSREADDKLERDLILAEPISFRPAGSTAMEPYEASVACISASRIVTMFVTYVQKPGSTSPVAAAVAAAAAAGLPEPPSAAGAQSSPSGPF